MSAFISVCYPDRIELLTDGAVYTEDGTLTDIREKVYRLKSVPAAIATRGVMSALDAIGPRLDVICALAGGFDAGMARMSNVLRKMHDRGVTLEFEGVIAGISEQNGPSNFYFTTGSHMEGIEPFTLYPADPELLGGTIPDPDEMLAAGITLESLANGLAERGADIMEFMRRKKGPNPAHLDRPELYGIGGHVDHTVVRREGVSTTRLRTWPDRIGEKIDPLSSNGNVVTLNRKQRRAANSNRRVA